MWPSARGAPEGSTVGNSTTSLLWRPGTPASADSLTDGEDGTGGPAEVIGRDGSTTCGRQFGEIRDGYLRVRCWALAAASRARSRQTVPQMRRTESPDGGSPFLF